MKEKFVTKVESGFNLVDKIIPYTLALICIYMAVIIGLTFLFGCKAPVNTCVKDKRYFAPAAEEAHSENNALYRKDRVNNSIRK